MTTPSGDEAQTSDESSDDWRNDPSQHPRQLPHRDQPRTHHADIEDASSPHTARKKSPTTRSNSNTAAPHSTASSSAPSSEHFGF